MSIIAVKCESSDFLAKIKNELLELHTTDHLSDFTITTSDQMSFKAHKVVLSMLVPYFKGMFKSDMIECRINEATLDTITGERFARILDYSYTGEVTLENGIPLKNLYVDAKFFCLHTLVHLCSEVLIENICDENVVDLLTFAEKNAAENLESHCLEYLEENATMLFKGVLVLELGPEQVKKMILREKLSCSEETKLDFALKWINYDFEDRKCFLDYILSQIDFLNISGNAMTEKFMSNDILRENKLFIDKTFIHYKSYVAKNNPTILPEFVNTTLSNKMLLFIGTDNIFQYECNSKTTKKINMSARSDYFAATNYRNNVFISGGVDSDKCLWYSQMSSNFKELPSMQKKRNRHKVVACKNQIFSCGGELNKRTVEVFDLGKGIWLEGPSMKKCDYEFGLSEKDGILYATGGFNAPKEGAFERLDPRENVWTSLHFFETQKVSSFTRSLIKDNSLYVFRLEGSGRVYDIRANKWMEEIIEMRPIATNLFFSICTLDEDMFIVKYEEDVATKQKLFRYDYANKGWRPELYTIPHSVWEILPIN